MSAPFAKLFDTPHGQLLAFLDQTEDYEPAIKLMGAEHAGVCPAMTLSGWDDAEEGQARAFAAIDQAAAEKHAAGFHNMLAKFAGGEA
jgi:hypothetical protein